jgi:predicted Zn finger-like uncharacterized protein
MLTRCPHCQTAFRVTSAQLKVRQGQVRCGTCSGVFDAFESLSDEQVVVVPAPEPLSPESPFPEPPAVQLAEAVAESEEASVAETPQVESAEPEPEPVVVVWEGGVQVEPPPRRWPWTLGVAAALLLTLGQLLFVFRVELAALMPELRPVLVAGCELAGCTVPRPRKPELVGIESSDLAPEGQDRLLLTALLKNRAPFDQEYPHLELTLTDTRDTALLRRVLAPAEYLPAGQAPAAGFAAYGEAAVRLRLEARDVPAVGYRLYLFYP